MAQSKDREQLGRSVERHRSFTQRTWIVVTIVTTVFLTLFVLWNASNIILVLFAGGLLAVFLHGVSQFIHSRTPLSRRAAMFATVIAIVAILGLASWFAAPAIVDQATRIGPELQRAINAVGERLGELPLGQTENGATGFVEQLVGVGSQLIGRVSDVFSTTFGFLTNAVVILFVGLYLAYEPGLYLRGVLKLVPKERRARLRDVLVEVYDSLRWWLVGRIAMMAIVAVLTASGLILLDVPLALLLGALAGLFAFIPYFGPLLALAPAVLIAYAGDPSTALYVLLLYIGVQIAEGYIITPFIEKEIVSLAPVLLIGAQLVLGALFGFWGLLLAPALVVTGRVAVLKLYVEDVLADYSHTYISDEHDDDDE